MARMISIMPNTTAALLYIPKSMISELKKAEYTNVLPSTLRITLSAILRLVYRLSARTISPGDLKTHLVQF